MPVKVVEYDPAWQHEFAEQRDRLKILLRGWLCEPVEHVGSTAVPGLASKPIVDILAPVTSLTDARGAVSILQQDGWLHWPSDPNKSWRLWFLRPRPDARTHHLYLIQHDDPHVDELRTFRDALRADDALRDRYEALKRRLAKEFRDTARPTPTPKPISSTTLSRADAREGELMEDALAPAPRSSFARYWTAAALSSFGSAVTGVAMPVPVVQLLGATPLQVGVVNAAQFVPYALLGLIAGAYTDRWRRKPVLVWASVGRALSLSAVPVLCFIGVLQIWMLVIALLVFGAFSAFGFAATQSLLPRLVPRARLVSANAQLDQADAAAAALGPAIGGGLVGLLGAPVAIAVDAISYLVDAALNASIQVDEPRPDSRTRNLRAEIREGLQWTYRHRTLGPLAASTHVWFFANGAAMTVLSLLALRSLGFTAYAFGMLLTVFGISSLVGASIAPRCGARLGSGRVIILARAACPIAWLVVAIAPPAGVGITLLFVALALQGLAAGVENSNEMGYWQALTPDGLLGRVNATRRSINQTMAALGALIAGLLVGPIGDRPTLIGVITAFAAAALNAALSPLREAPIRD